MKLSLAHEKTRSHFLTNLNIHLLIVTDNGFQSDSIESFAHPGKRGEKERSPRSVGRNSHCLIFIRESEWSRRRSKYPRNVERSIHPLYVPTPR